MTLNRFCVHELYNIVWFHNIIVCFVTGYSIKLSPVKVNVRLIAKARVCGEGVGSSELIIVWNNAFVLGNHDVSTRVALVPLLDVEQVIE